MKPSPNATWEVRPTPPLVITTAPYGVKMHCQKKEEARRDNDEGLFYSIRGQESYSSFTSVSTAPSSRETSRKSTHSKARTRRSQRRKSSSSSSASTKYKAEAFDPARKPLKSCVKQGSEPTSTRRQRKRGSFYNIHLPGVVGTVKRQRAVRFNKQVFVREVRSSLSVVENNPSVLWWQDDEHEAIKKNLQRILSRVDKHGVAKSNGKRYCTRGLERFLDPDTDWEADRVEAEETVYREQSHQHECGIFDDLRIAAVYFRSTRTSLRRAVRRGCEDAIIAASIYEEDAHGSSSSSQLRPSLSSKSMNRSLSSRSLNASIGLASPGLAPSQLPKRSSSFSILTGKSLRRNSGQYQRPAVPSMA